MALGKGYNTLLGVDASDKATKKTTNKSTKPAKKPAPAPAKPIIKEVIKEVPAETKLKLSEIEPNTGQPRKEFNEDLLAELADSIKKYGIIQPIVVTKKGKGYQIIAGERRWRAARMAGLKEIPAIVREYTDKESMEVALIENLQRSDLNAVEEALAYQNLIDVYNLKQDEVAERVSKSRTAVTNSLRLLKLCDKVKQMLVDDMISTGHARALLAIEDPNVQYETALSVFDEGLSVRETEQLVKGVNNILSGNEIDDNGQIKVKKKDEALEAILNSMAEDLKTIIGSKVAIKSTGNGKKGKLEIEYVSNDDLERIIHIIKAGAAL